MMMERKQVYAGPMMFSSWHVVASHIGSLSYSFTVTPIGDTVVVGQIRYFKAEHDQVVEDFQETIEIQTGNVVANVEMRLKGAPSGSSCWVDVE